jgi:formate transporter
MSAQFEPIQESSFASDSLIPTQSFIDAISKIPLPKVNLNIDCLVPKQCALKIEAASVKKAKDLTIINTLLLAFHAGMFFGLGSAFYGVVMVGNTHYGLQQMCGGFAYATGLSMVVLNGAELFTGNLLMIIAWMSKRITTFQMFKNWFIVLLGNLAGSLTMAILQTWGRTHENSSYGVGQAALNIAQLKCNRNFGASVAQGILSNLLMCWAIWMVTAGVNGLDKQLVLILPVACMGALGWEHIVSNFYFIPVALMIETYAFPKMWATLANIPLAQATPGWIDAYQTAAWPNVNWSQMIIYNFIPTTIGNIIGAFCFIGIVYWYLFLRDENHESRVGFHIGSIPIWCSPPNGIKPPKRSHEESKAAVAAKYEPPAVQQQQQPVMQVEMQPAFSPAGNTLTYPTPIPTPEMFRA